MGPDRRRALLALGFAALLAGTPVPAVHAQRLYEDFVLAVANDRVDEVRQFLARGVDPDTVDLAADPVLLVAARAGYRATLDALLAAHANVDAHNPFGDTAIMVAALKGHLGIVRTLRERGAKVNRPGWTPLMYAAAGGHDDIVRYLLAAGAQINAASPNGTTALMMAVREAHPETVALLLRSGAELNHRNDDGASALDWARRSQDSSLVETLQRAGAR